MAQVITRCRLTGHYMFMGMEADPRNSPGLPVPLRASSVRSVPAIICGTRKISKFLAPKVAPRPAHPASELTAKRRPRQRRRRSSQEAPADGGEIHVPSRTPTPRNRS